jgi:hypothetical protein
MGIITKYGEDISNDEYTLTKAQFKDMVLRRDQWNQKTGLEPNFVRLPSPDNNAYVSCGVTGGRMEEMEHRWLQWKANHNGQEPNYIWVVRPQITPPTPLTDWVLTGLFTQDKQDTPYTCGPSSAQMVFSALGYSFSESQIASLAGTTTAGTSHQGLYGAMKKLVPNLQIAEYYLSECGFQCIIDKLKTGREVILHIQTYPALSKDADNNSVWLKNYGHYIFLVGINPASKRVRVADPTKGVKEFTYQQITNAINAVSNQKSVMIFYKP